MSRQIMPHGSLFPYQEPIAPYDFFSPSPWRPYAFDDMSLFQNARRHIMRMFDEMDHMFQPNMNFPLSSTFNPNDPNVVSHALESKSMMQYSNINGKPKLIQAHDEKEMGPGGVWRTRKALRDTDRKIEKMQEGLFIGERGQIMERWRNPATGQLEDRVYHQKLSEADKYRFVDEWNQRARMAREALSHADPAFHDTQRIPIAY